MISAVLFSKPKMKQPPMSDKPNRAKEQNTSDPAKLWDLSLKGGLGLVPGGGYLYDLLKLRKDTIRDAVRKKDEETLDAFFSELLCGESALDSSIVDALIDDRDFHSLVRACIADIETEKREAYAALAKSISCGRVSGDWKRHFILSLKDMSLKEMEYLRLAYVAKHFRLVPKGVEGTVVKETDFLLAGQPGSYQSIAVSNLVTRGFAHEGKLSSTGEDFVMACSKDIRLTPAALGYKEWSSEHIAIISYELGNNSISSRASELERALRDYQIKTSIISITRNSQQQAQIFSTQGVLLLGQQTRAIEEHVKALAEYASRIPLVLVKMDGQSGSLPPEILISNVIDFDSDFQVTMRKLLAALRLARYDE